MLTHRPLRQTKTFQQTLRVLTATLLGLAQVEVVRKACIKILPLNWLEYLLLWIGITYLHWALGWTRCTFLSTADLRLYLCLLLIWIVMMLKYNLCAWVGALFCLSTIYACFYLLETFILILTLQWSLNRLDHVQVLHVPVGWLFILSHRNSHQLQWPIALMALSQCLYSYFYFLVFVHIFHFSFFRILDLCLNQVLRFAQLKLRERDRRIAELSSISVLHQQLCVHTELLQLSYLLQMRQTAVLHEFYLWVYNWLVIFHVWFDLFCEDGFQFILIVRGFYILLGRILLEVVLNCWLEPPLGSDALLWLCWFQVIAVLRDGHLCQGLLVDISRWLL